MRSLEALMVYAALGLEAMPPRHTYGPGSSAGGEYSADDGGAHPGGSRYTPPSTSTPRHGNYSAGGAPSEASTPDSLYTSTPLPAGTTTATQGTPMAGLPGYAPSRDKAVDSDTLLQCHKTIRA
jgi:hypothetical protein